MSEAWKPKLTLLVSEVEGDEHWQKMRMDLEILILKHYIPHAILIRGIKLSDKKIVGPGNVTKALGFDMSFNGESLLEKNRIWLEEKDKMPTQILASPRIGIVV